MGRSGPLGSPEEGAAAGRGKRETPSLWGAVGCGGRVTAQQGSGAAGLGGLRRKFALYSKSIEKPLEKCKLIYVLGRILWTQRTTVGDHSRDTAGWRAIWW